MLNAVVWLTVAFASQCALIRIVAVGICPFARTRSESSNWEPCISNPPSKHVMNSDGKVIAQIIGPVTAVGLTSVSSLIKAQGISPVDESPVRPDSDVAQGFSKTSATYTKCASPDTGSGARC